MTTHLDRPLVAGCSIGDKPLPVWQTGSEESVIFRQFLSHHITSSFSYQFGLNFSCEAVKMGRGIGTLTV